MNKNYINYLNSSLNNVKNQRKELDLKNLKLSMKIDDLVFVKFLNFFKSLIVALLIFITSNPFLIGFFAGLSLFSYLRRNKKIKAKEQELYDQKDEILDELYRLDKIIDETSRKIAKEFNEDKNNHVREDKYIYEDEIHFEEEKEKTLNLRKK